MASKRLCLRTSKRSEGNAPVDICNGHCKCLCIYSFQSATNHVRLFARESILLLLAEIRHIATTLRYLYAVFFFLFFWYFPTRVLQNWCSPKTESFELKQFTNHLNLVEVKLYFTRSGKRVTTISTESDHLILILQKLCIWKI